VARTHRTQLVSLNPQDVLRSGRHVTLKRVPTVCNPESESEPKCLVGNVGAVLANDSQFHSTLLDLTDEPLIEEQVRRLGRRASECRSSFWTLRDSWESSSTADGDGSPSSTSDGDGSPSSVSLIVAAEVNSGSPFAQPIV
jgi:hypothetical protein